MRRRRIGRASACRGARCGLHGGNCASRERCGGRAPRQDEGRLLLTDDKDFGDLVFRRGAQAPGIVLLRIDPAMHALKARRPEAAIARFGDSLFGRYTIVEEARFRARPLRGM